MAQVVKMIEDNSMMNTRNGLQPKLVFIEGLNPDFHLKDMFRASVEVLGRETFGTSYKATLENGSTNIEFVQIEGSYSYKYRISAANGGHWENEERKCCYINVILLLACTKAYGV
ncbi:unnamed protein product [Fraxinus pennsylvanica]|uniref:Uncharacterized protein n=1 Tax=Fraxinus pennsylvanica TaxID=56036 RepID=A0AAD1ZF86_9LAMI|nr:unnamed protein product [Fraxinus pennsylvanica]